MGLLNDSQRKYAEKRLIKALDNYGWRIGTGFLSTPLILDVLEKLDVSYAYRLLENEEMPGWLFMPKNGATTIWESWEGNMTKDAGIASLNHYSKGAVCEWLIRRMCGIDVSGENRFTVAPCPGGSLVSAKATYDSIYGRISSGWKKEKNGYLYEIEIPSNTTARIVLPGGTSIEAGAGNYTFREKI